MVVRRIGSDVHGLLSEHVRMSRLPTGRTSVRPVDRPLVDSPVRIVVEGQHAQHAGMQGLARHGVRHLDRGWHLQRERPRSPTFAAFDPPVAQLMKADKSGMRQFECSGTTSPRGIGYSGHKLKLFTFPGTLTGYRPSKRRRDDSHPHRERSGYGYENTHETADRGVGARHCCGGGVLVYDSGT